MEKREAFYTIGGNVNWYSHYGEKYRGSLKKTKLPHDPTIPLLDLHPEKNANSKIHMHLNVHRSTVYNNQDTEAT